MDKPIYQQVSDYLSDEIQSMPANTPIPSERELAQLTGASRMTVRKAVNQLVEEGLLYRDKNKGTFVADQKMHKRKPSHTLFLSNDKSNFKILHFDVKDYVLEVSKNLEIDMEDSFIKLVRLNLENKKPVSIDEIYVVRKMVKNFNPSDASSLLDLESIASKGAVNQTFKPMLVPVQYANLLELKLNSPIIVIESRVYTPQGRVYAFVVTYSHPQRVNLEFTL